MQKINTTIYTSGAFNLTRSFLFSKLPLTLLFSLIFGTANAGLLRVNNTLATDKAKKIYASLQAAHDDATSGSDTLLVEGSTTPYTTLDCSKKLVIIGTGYFLTLNQGQANAIPSTVQVINFKPGSEGSAIIGMAFAQGNSSYAPHIFTSGIAIIRCYLDNSIYLEASITSLVILQNFISNSLFYTINSTLTFTGVIVKNNIVDQIYVPSSAQTPRVFAAVEHNIINGQTTLSATSFRSNIITSSNNTVSITSTAIQNNLVLGTQLNDIPSNQSYQSNSKLFVGLAAANNSTDGQFKILSTSTFAKAGYNNEEPGVFGGTEPYVLSGIPPIPSIYELQSDAVANKTDGLNVTLKARANQ